MSHAMDKPKIGLARAGSKGGYEAGPKSVSELGPPPKGPAPGAAPSTTPKK